MLLKDACIPTVGEMTSPRKDQCLPALLIGIAAYYLDQRCSAFEPRELHEGWGAGLAGPVSQDQAPRCLP